MNNSQKINREKQLWAWGWLILGVILIVAGLALQFLMQVSFNPRIVSGLGIFLAGTGGAELIYFYTLKKEPKTRQRLYNEEKDERSRMIRDRAGSRGFYGAMGMVFIGLMWVSFAGNGSLPTPSMDVLWFYLAATFCIPGLIYLGSIIYDQNNL
jgi:hypothetical protein